MMKGVKHKKNKWYKELQNTIRNDSSASVSKIIDLASEKGASCWLTSLPLQRYGFVLNKQQFHDSICLRYINNKGILDRGPIILITRQANNQSLNSAQNQGDQESSIRQQRLLRPVSPSTKLLTQGGAKN